MLCFERNFVVIVMKGKIGCVVPVVDLGGGRGCAPPQALVNRGAWGCKNDVYPNSNQLMLRNSVGYH